MEFLYFIFFANLSLTWTVMGEDIYDTVYTQILIFSIIARKKFVGLFDKQDGK